MKPLVLTSSPPPPESLSPGPRTDFIELARLLEADISYPLPPAGIWGRVEKALASDIRQARAAARQRGHAPLISLSEKVGLPLAFLTRRPQVLLAHNLTSARKTSLQRRTGWLRRFERIVVLCREQENYLLGEAGISPERVRFVYDKVDHRFFAPQPEIAVEPGLVLAVGRERRDYATLLSAMRQLPEARAVIVASSPWARREAAGEQAPEASNVTFVRGLSFCELRDLYARSAAVCVPLEPGTRYAAGVNAVLEAMAMARAPIVTQTPGIVDYLEAGASVAVAAADSEALAGALAQALARPAHCDAARTLIESGRNLEAYLAALVEAIAL